MKFVQILNIIGIMKTGDLRKMDLTEYQGNINPHLRNIKEDTLYHIGLTHGKQDLKKMFGDVKVYLQIYRICRND